MERSDEMSELDQTVILAISQMKDFEKFLVSDMTYCALMDVHIGQLKYMVDAAHAKGKKVFFHMDLLQGLTNDEYGCEYSCQMLKADGVISTKAKVLSTAKKNLCLAILRLFLIDTKSLKKGIALCQAVKPDYIEVLPGFSCSLLPYIQQEIETKIMCGGLIRTAEEIQYCFQMGAHAVTISNRKAADEYMEKRKRLM